jgi:hypothetical protein
MRRAVREISVIGRSAAPAMRDPERDEDQQRLAVSRQRLLRSPEGHPDLHELAVASGRDRQDPEALSRQLGRLERGPPGGRVPARRVGGRQPPAAQVARGQAGAAESVHELEEGAVKLDGQARPDGSLAPRRTGGRGSAVADDRRDHLQRGVEVPHQAPAQEGERERADDQQDRQQHARVPERQPGADGERPRPEPHRSALSA